MKPSAIDLSALFDPIEEAFLYDYFRIPRPKNLKDIDIYGDCSAGNNEGPPNGVRLQLDYTGDPNHNSLENAVARLLLNGIQGRLPQWGVIYGDGRIEQARDYESHRQRVVSFAPQLLFQINWADSGPGFSWPETYFVTFVPGFDRYVVTASQDSPDAYGFADLSIGHFGLGEDVATACQRIIAGWWKENTNGDPMLSWQCVWDTGLISSDEAEQWAESLWGSEEEREAAKQ